MPHRRSFSGRPIQPISSWNCRRPYGPIYPLILLRYFAGMKPDNFSTQAPPAITGVIETALYVDDLSRAIPFYQGLFGFPILQQDHRFCAFDIAGRSILLLFLRGASLEPAPLSWGDMIPPHDGKGPLHFAFAIPRGSDGAWEIHLRNAGITIESTITWPRGGRSLYFRDPDGHAVELLTPGVWETY